VDDGGRARAPHGVDYFRRDLLQRMALQIQRQYRDGMMHDRRRFLQILAAAPFAPWEEISRELAKPIIAYSIPKEIQYAVKKSPLSITVAGGHFFDVGDVVTLYTGYGRADGVFTISHMDEIARVIYFDSKLVENAALIQP
jgi:hypothetical protein